MRPVLLAALSLPLLAAPARAEDGTALEVVVAGVRSAQGQVRVAVCTQAEFLQPHCRLHASAPSRTGSTVVRVTGIPPGTYAVQAWHDANDDGVIDRNFLGLPTEDLGFSRDAPMRFGPPRFDDAAVRIEPGGGRITLTLRRF